MSHVGVSVGRWLQKLILRCRSLLRSTRVDAALDEELRFHIDRQIEQLVSQEIGFGAMSAALLKQVIVVLLRRSISSMQSWVERFSMLRDPQIARAFSEMAAQPGRHHSLQSLAQCAAACGRQPINSRRARSHWIRSPVMRGTTAAAAS